MTHVGVIVRLIATQGEILAHCIYLYLLNQISSYNPSVFLLNLRALC